MIFIYIGYNFPFLEKKDLYCNFFKLILSNQSDIFNFVAIRNPLLIDKSKTDARFIFDKRLEEESEVLSSIKNNSDHNEIYNLIKGIITQRNYTANFTLDKYPKFVEIFDLMSEHREKFDKHIFIKEMEKILTIDPKKYILEKRTVLISNELWESLYAFTKISSKEPRNIQVITECLRILHTIENAYSITDEDSFITVCESVPCLPDMFFGTSEGPFLYTPPECDLDLWAAPYLHPQFPPPGTVRVLGVGDLKVVKQKLLKYELGEIAHIENVLKSEVKDRTHKTLDRTEQIDTIENEKVEVEEKDLQSTERFELKSEAQKTIIDQSGLQAGVTVSGGYGPIQITAQTNFSTSTSTTDSIRNSQTFAKEVISKSVSKIQNRVKEARTTKTIKEIEEINHHGFNNIGPTAVNISGIFRWVDKRYQAQVYNYGKRLMFEFIIPEPAAYYNYLQGRKPLKGTDLLKPSPPLNAIGRPLSPKDIDENNYLDFIRDYGVSDATPPPVKDITMGIPIDQPSTGKEDSFSKSISDLKVPEGYEAIKARVTGLVQGRETPDHSVLTLSIGSIEIPIVGITSSGWHNFKEDGKFKDTVPIAILARTTITYAIAVEIFCKRLPEKLQTWQLNTFKSIITAYEVSLSNYNDQVRSNEINEGIIISGRNPKRNREIEKIELKKSCLVMFTRQDFRDFGALYYITGGGYTNDIDIGTALSQGKYIQFFEQAFDWENMTYLFYPYFWGTRWDESQFRSDPDPLFLSFLQAGAARVIVPAKLEYQESLLFFLETLPPKGCGQIWEGGDPPTLNDPLYLSIVDEMKSAAGVLDEPTPEGKPWDVIIPTDLVYLQLDSDLPDFTKSP